MTDLPKISIEAASRWLAEPSAQCPTITKHFDGTVTVDWHTPDGKPGAGPVLMAPEIVTACVESINEAVGLRARVSELEAAARTPEDDAVIAAADRAAELHVVEWTSGSSGKAWARRSLLAAVVARREALGASQ